MMFPLLASVAFGFLKGLNTPGQAPFRPEQDFLGPLKEELLYRGAALWSAPTLPFGSTAAVFALDHIASDMRHASTPMTASQVVGRFGDVLLGGCLYEAAFRRYGILGAVGAHVGHNLAVGLGSTMRGRRR